MKEKTFEISCADAAGLLMAHSLLGKIAAEGATRDDIEEAGYLYKRLGEILTRAETRRNPSAVQRVQLGTERGKRNTHRGLYHIGFQKSTTF